MDLTVEGKIYINGDFQDCCIGITDGRISNIKKILKGDKHYKFGHKLILPAGIDIHVHFRDPGMKNKEDFSTGSIAAAFGGISCVFDMHLEVAKLLCRYLKETLSHPNLVR